MFTDPISVSYNGSSKTLPRVSLRGSSSLYRTADGEFEVSISKFPDRRTRQALVQLMLSRTLPDSTPVNVFDDYRPIRNSFGIVYGFDSDTLYQANVDGPLLRAAVLALADSTFTSRLVSGEI